MKKLTVLGALALAACQPKGTEEARQNAESELLALTGLVAKVDGAACAHPETERVIREIAVGQRRDPADSLHVQTSLELVTLEGIDQVTGRIDCHGTWEVRVADELVSTAPVDYSVQLNVHRDDVVVTLRGTRAVGAALAQAVYHRPDRSSEVVTSYAGEGSYMEPASAPPLRDPA